MIKLVFYVENPTLKTYQNNRTRKKIKFFSQSPNDKALQRTHRLITDHSFHETLDIQAKENQKKIHTRLSFHAHQIICNRYSVATPDNPLHQRRIARLRQTTWLQRSRFTAGNP